MAALLRYKSKDELEQTFSNAGVKWDHPVVMTCGSGVTASLLTLGLRQIKPDHPVRPFIIVSLLIYQY